jgi:hypothetical protein
MAAITGTCIVCGRISTRAVWNNNNVFGTTNVACDFHSQNAIQHAIISGKPATPSGLNLPRTMHEKEST